MKPEDASTPEQDTGLAVAGSSRSPAFVGAVSRLADKSSHFGFVSELVDIMGAEATLALLLTYGGTRIYVPATMPENHPFAKLLGLEAARLLSSNFAALDVMLPLGQKMRLHKDVDELRERLEAGASSRDLAAEFGTTSRTIWRQIAKHRFVRLPFGVLVDLLEYEGAIAFAWTYGLRFQTVMLPFDTKSSIAALVGATEAQELSDWLLEKYGKGRTHIMPDHAAYTKAGVVAQVWHLAWQGSDGIEIAQETGIWLRQVEQMLEPFEELNGKYQPPTLALFGAISKAKRAGSYQSPLLPLLKPV